MTSKAINDIRATSYDAATANANGYIGTIEDALAQIRAEPGVKPFPISARTELLMFLGVDKIQSKLPVPEDDSVIYGEAGAPGSRGGMSPYALEYAMERWPENFSRQQKRVAIDKTYHVSRTTDVGDRIAALNVRQMDIYWESRLTFGIRVSLGIAERAS